MHCCFVCWTSGKLEYITADRQTDSTCRVGMWWSRVKSAYVAIQILCFKSVRCRHRFQCLWSYDLMALYKYGYYDYYHYYLPRDHSLFSWIAVYRCLHILTPNWTTYPGPLRCTILYRQQTSRNSYSVCICLLLHGNGRTAMSDEWEVYAINSKSESDVNESVNPPHFGFA